MAKEKLTLSELKVQSFVTTLESAQMNQVRGGYMVVRGRRFAYNTRWTFIDTRSNSEIIGAGSVPGNGG
ncbi:MAG: pinensin family lanthipeptide [Bacteroidota bacterium]